MFVGIVLVVGFALFKSLPNQPEAEEGNPDDAPKGSSPVAAEFGTLGEDGVKASSELVGTNSVSFDSSAGYEVIDERQTMNADGSIERRRLVKRAGAHPNRIVVETLRRDFSTKRFVVAGMVEMAADHVIVSLHKETDRQALGEVAATFNAKVGRPLADGRTFVVALEAPGLDAVEGAVEYFKGAASSIAYAEPDYVRHFAKIPNDTMYGDLWGMPTISAPDAWDITTGSKDVTVAVIDSGMDMDHPDLVSNRWLNEGEIPNDNLDNDGNGYVDDVNGWDFVSGDNQPEDDDGHGTHCAGTIGATGNNNNQVVGVCWDVSIMPVKAGDATGLLDSDIVDSIRYAARNGAKVLSNSYGGSGYSQTIYDAVEFAYEQGAIFIAAAGNDGTSNDSVPQYPASYDLPNVVAVAATDDGDNLASFSNFGVESVDLAAPGVGIVSTYLNGETASLDGTSMACPHVAGAMGLLYSVLPGLTPEEAKSLLMAGVDELTSLSDKVASGGRLNVNALFANANDTDRDGMPDTWEVHYGLDPDDPTDAALDNDGDFLSNLQEFRNGCDPNNSDTDGDSLIDGWEVLYNFNPVNVPGKLPKLQYLGFNADCKDTYEVAIQGNYAYVADGQYGLKVLKLTDPANPVLVGSYATAGVAEGVDVQGDYAYVADATNGLFIIDISKPDDPILEASLPTTALKVDVVGDYAYVAAYTEGLKIAAVSDPANSDWAGTYYHPGIEAYAIAVDGGVAYLGADGANARINVGNPASPTLMNSHINGNDGVGMAILPGNVLAATTPYGVTAYTSSLQAFSGYPTEGGIEDVCYSEGLVYVADGDDGLLILNGTDLSAMTYYASYDRIRAYGVTVDGGYAYVAGKSSGVQVFRSSVDTDADGMYDGWEIQHFGSLAQGAFDDPDNDGINNWGEYLANLVPTSADQDADGLIDGFDEVRIHLTDPRKPDTDLDGLGDGVEVTTNGVDNVYITDPLKADTDGDGMTDKWEIDNGLDPTFDDGDLDPDNDGATNREEEQAGTDPNNWDTDGDGMADGWESDVGLNPLMDDASEDPDGDNTVPGLDLTNLGEYLWGSNGIPGFIQEPTDPNAADSDGDQLGDNWEAIADGRTEIAFNGNPITNLYVTDPNNIDTDGDGLPDGWEEAYYISPIDDGSINTNNGAGGDADNDGLTNEEEFHNGSDPFNADTDGDSFADGWEREWGTQSTNRYDPMVVDDDAPGDFWKHYPDISHFEDGSTNAPYDSIQEAIDDTNTVDGTTVFVLPGEYGYGGNRNIDMRGKALRLISEQGAANTFIKSDGIAPVFVFDDGDDQSTILDGFSIWSSVPGGEDCSSGDCGEMHGIICKDASSPLIQNCIVEHCKVDAIYCEFGSDAIISNTIVRYTYEGAGIKAVESTPLIVDCWISFSAGGIYAVDSQGLVVSNTVVEQCSNSLGEGRGIHIENDSSCLIYNSTIRSNQGGIKFESSRGGIERCEISGNVAPDYYQWGGGLRTAWTNIAVWADLNPEATDVPDEDENGAGIRLHGVSSAHIFNCVMENNRTSAIDPDIPDNQPIGLPMFGLGGGMAIGASCYASNINNTIVGNVAMTHGGGIATHGNYPEFVMTSILWSNTCNDAWFDKDAKVLRTPGDEEYDSLVCVDGPSTFDVRFCVLSHGASYTNAPINFDADPEFVDSGHSDYQLVGSSPCIDRAPLETGTIEDFLGVPRPLDGNDDGYAIIDIGAYEYVHPTADTDGDGVSDWIEVHTNMTDPTDRASFMNALMTSFMQVFGLQSLAADDDGDGLSNMEEYEANTDPTSEDTDGDNSPDGDELVAGTDAVDPASYFYVSDVRPTAGGGCKVAFDTVVGRTYTVYCSSQLGGGWIPVGLGVAGTGAEVEVEDSVSEAACFYKVEVSN